MTTGVASEKMASSTSSGGSGAGITAAVENAERRFARLSSPEGLARLAGRKNENYRYTSLKDVELDRRPSFVSAGNELSAELVGHDEAESLLIVNRARAAEPVIAYRGDSDHGAYVASLEVALRERPDLFGADGRFAEIFPEVFPKIFKEDVFANLAAARAANGIVIYVPRGVRVDGVIRTLHQFDADTSTALPRVIVLADEGSELTYVDEFRGAGLLNGKAPLSAGLIQVHALSGARVRYAQVQDWGSNVQGFLRQSVIAERDAEVSIVSVASGARKFQSRFELEFRGRGSRITFHGAARGEDSQHFDYWVTANHSVADTSSDMRHFTVMADSARSVFNGKIHITRDGARTDANQQNRNMVLSKKAAADAFPKLEIATDDVKCAHGAAIVPIDPAQLYYLRSRGISKNDAELMIINGFTESVVDLLPTTLLKDRVHAAFERKHALVGSGEGA